MKVVVSVVVAGTALIRAQAAQAPGADLETLFKKGDFTAFFKAAAPRAERGDALALFLCGKAYHLGKGVERDTRLAMEYYGRAAEQGEPRALHNLGLLELDETLNLASARLHLERALELGLKLPTLYTLGRAYDHRQMMAWDDPTELVKARDYYFAAFEAGFGPEALDDALAAGVKAWLAPGHGPEDGPAFRDALRAEVLRLGGIGAKLNRPRCLQNLGAFYFYAKEYEAALPWVRRAAAMDQPVALYTLGLMRRDGLGLSKDPESAEEAWERAAVLGHALAAREVEQYWDQRVRRQEERAALELARDRMRALRQGRPEDGLFLEWPLGIAEGRLRVLEAVDSMAKAGPIPGGPVALRFRLLDLPEEEGGVPEMNLAWSIQSVPLGTPVWNPPGGGRVLARGLLDAQGTPHLAEGAAERLKESLVRGESLLFCWPGQRRLLRWTHRPEGGVALDLGPQVPD